MTTEELAALLTAQTDIDFVETHLLGRRPWIFDTDKTYDEWRVAVARALLVDPISVQIVGSAATGYSLEPAKAWASVPAIGIQRSLRIRHRHCSYRYRPIRSRLGYDLAT